MPQTRGKTASRSTAKTKTSSTKSTSMDALSLLKQDHRKVEDLFADFTKARSEDRKHAISQDVCRELTVHAGIEEKSFYPELRKVKELEDTVMESLEEHHVVKQLVSEIEALQASDEHLEPKMTVLEENVKHHVEEEEKELFPKVTKALSKERLEELGQQLQQDKTAIMGRLGRGEAMPEERRVVEEVSEPGTARRR